MPCAPESSWINEIEQRRKYQVDDDDEGDGSDDGGGGRTSNLFRARAGGKAFLASDCRDDQSEYLALDESGLDVASDN